MELRPCSMMSLLLCGIVLFTATTVEGRQMCLSCQYQTLAATFLPCLEDPWNWPGGNVRTRCNFRCLFSLRRSIESDEITYAYRGCTANNDVQENGCTEVSGVQTCYFTCLGEDYCNSWNASDITSGAAPSPRQWSPLLLAFAALSPVAGLTRCFMT